MSYYGRTRTINGVVASNWKWQNRYTNVPTLPDYIGYSAGNGNGESSTIKDSVHPNARLRMSKGELLASDVLLTKQSRTYTPGSLMEGPCVLNGFLGKAGSTCEHSQDMCSPVENAVGNPFTGDKLSADSGRRASIALAKAYAKMNQSSLMSGEVLRDLNTTVAMLRRPFGSAQKLVNRMLTRRKKFRTKDYAETLKVNADIWLEYRYGWKPLLMDCDTILEEILVRRNRESWARLVARASEDASYNYTHGFSSVPFSGDWRASGTLHRDHKMKVSAGVMYVPSGSQHDILKFLGMRPNDLPSTFWNIIPYSFVVDWFANVGTWIEAITPNPSVRVVMSWVTIVDEIVDTLTISNLQVTRNYPPSLTFTGSGGGSVRTSLTYKRDMNPTLSSTPVLLTQSLGGLQSADGVALIAGQVATMLKRMPVISRYDRSIYTD